MFALPSPEFLRDDFLIMLSRNQRTIFQICLHFTDCQPDNIRDLYQEIARTLWEAWPNFRGESAVDTWVRRIALNVAVNEMRSLAKRPQFVPLEDWMYDTIADEMHKAPPNYFRLMEHLDPDERVLVYLRLEKYQMSEIAEILSISEDAVKQRYRRLRQKIDIIKQKEFNDI